MLTSSPDGGDRDGGEFLIISDSAEMGGDFRGGSRMAGETGSDTSSMVPGRDSS